MANPLQGHSPLCPFQDASHALSAWSGHPNRDSTAVISAQSFWDYASEADRAIPGLGAAYRASGRCFSVAAGRISFTFGLQGDALI